MDIDRIRQDFPVIANRQMAGHSLVYLDSAATAQKPQCVIDAITDFYTNNYSSINRGVYELAEKTTLAYEASRLQVAEFIGCSDSRQIVFTSGTTESINLVAHGLASCSLQAGDEIIVSQMEHHANIVPWQQAGNKTGAIIKVAPLTADGQLDLAGLAALIGPKTKLIALIHVSNVLGCVSPVKQVIELAKAKGIITLIDGAQAVAHVPVNVTELDCDFYVFSAHKLYGPTGVGVLYAKHQWLDAMPPYQCGGDMIRRVTFEKTTFNEAPHKFEAGTPNIAGVIGFAEAIRYFQQFSWEEKIQHEQEVMRYLDEGLRQFDDLMLYGPAVEDRKAVASFLLKDIHAHDVGSFLGNEGVAVRVGHHCTMPLMKYLGVAATTRASVGIYSSKADVDRLVEAIGKLRVFFG